MSINLQKGQKIDLTKTNTGLTKVMIGLGWDTNKFSGDSFDLDSVACLIGESDKVENDTDLIYFNNLKHGSLSVIHMGDNLTGDGDGDDEKILVDLSLVPDCIKKIKFAVTIFQAESRSQNFGMVGNAFIRVVKDGTTEELIRYDLSEDFSIETGVIIGELYRHGTEWKFAALGNGFQGGLASLKG